MEAITRRGRSVIAELVHVPFEVAAGVDRAVVARQLRVEERAPGRRSGRRRSARSDDPGRFEGSYSA
jgi:hypothetical protein